MPIIIWSGMRRSAKVTPSGAKRSQAVARARQLFKEVTEQRKLERAYAASSAQDLVMDTQFERARNDGLPDERW
jgi:hypothetical protein